jgi:hypothetical protein
MPSRSLSILTLCLIPTIVAAQRSGGSGASDRFGGGKAGRQADWDRINGENAGGLQLSNKDLEGISPIKLLIDKRKDLKLTDDQQKHLKGMEAPLKEKNQQLFKALDSLRGEVKKAQYSQDARPVGTRAEVVRVVGEIRENYAGALKDAMAIFDDTQRASATELAKKQTEDADKMVREKLWGEGEHRGGPPTKE